MMQTSQLAVGVDIGGTNMKIALINKQGEIIEGNSIRLKRTTDHSADLTFICKKVKNFIRKSNVSNKILGIGVASPGILDVGKGTVNYAVNLGWKNLKLVEIMQDYLQFKVTLISDAVAGAIGEHNYTASGLNDYMYICIGTGLGASFIKNGEIFNGGGGAVNLGHMSIIYDGEVCKCGNVGCLEKYVSATGLINKIKASYPKKNHLFNELLEENEDLGAYHIYKMAQKGDTYALSLFQEAGKLLGIAIVNCIHLFGTYNYIIGGGVSQAGDYIIQPAQEEVRRRYRENKINILESIVPTKSGVIGTALHVFANKLGN